MSLFGKSDAKIVKKVHTWFNDAQKKTRKWRLGAQEDYEFYAGDQWSEDDVTHLERNDRPVITFNRVAPVIDSISGSERNNRQEVKYLPRESNDGQVTEMFSAAGKWVRDESDAEDEESEAFVDCVITGMGWTETWISFQDEIDGKIMIDRVPPLEMYWDPDAKKRNLSDARYVMRIKIMEKDDIKRQFPGKKLNLAGDIGFTPQVVEEPHDQDEARFYNKDQAGRKLERNEVSVAQVQWWEPVPLVRFFNPESNEEEELTGSEFDALQKTGVVQDLQDNFPDKFVPPLRQTRRQYFQAFIVGRTMLKKEVLHPMEDSVIPGFTLKAITAKRDERNNVWFGVMKGMKDPQRWSNKFFSLILEIIQTNAKGGLIAEQGAFVNERQAEEDWSSPDSIVWVNTGTLSGEKPSVIPKPTAPFPSGIDRMMQFSISSTRETAGFNLEALGLAGRTQAGVVESSRIKQSMVTLSVIFDSMRRYRKEQGRVLLHFMRKYLQDGILMRVVGEDRFVKFSQNPEIKRFDIVVDQAPTSPTMKEETWAGLQQILPALIKAGLPIPPDIIDFAPLPQSVITKIKQFYQSLQPGEQEQALKQASQQVGFQQQQADVKKTLSEADKNQATADSNRKARELDREKATTEAFQKQSEIDLDRETKTAESFQRQGKLNNEQQQNAIKIAELITKTLMENNDGRGNSS